MSEQILYIASNSGKTIQVKWNNISKQYSVDFADGNGWISNCGNADSAEEARRKTEHVLRKLGQI